MLPTRALGSSSPTFSLTFLLSVPFNVSDNSHICYTKIYGMIINLFLMLHVPNLISRESYLAFQINLFLMLHVPNLISRESYLAFQPLQKFKTEIELHVPNLISRESYLAFQPLQKFKTEIEGLYLPSTT